MLPKLVNLRSDMDTLLRFLSKPKAFPALERVVQVDDSDLAPERSTLLKFFEQLAHTTVSHISICFDEHPDIFQRFVRNLRRPTTVEHTLKFVTSMELRIRTTDHISGAMQHILPRWLALFPALAFLSFSRSKYCVVREDEEAALAKNIVAMCQKIKNVAFRGTVADRHFVP